MVQNSGTEWINMAVLSLYFCTFSKKQSVLLYFFCTFWRGENNSKNIYINNNSTIVQKYSMTL